MKLGGSVAGGGSPRGAARRYLAAGVVAVALAGCAVSRHKPPDPAQGLRDIHDRLSAISTRQGFHNGIHTSEGTAGRLDYLFIRFTLDGVKRRHESLDDLLGLIGRVCASPEFAGLAIEVEVRSPEEADRRYLRDTVAGAAGNRPNIAVLPRAAGYSGIIISVTRPRQDFVMR